MFQAKIGFLDRVEQSFLLYKENFLPLILPFIIFNFIFLVALPLFFGILFNSFFPLSELSFGEQGMPLSFSTNIAITFGVTLIGMMLLIYLFVLIPLQIGTMRSIKQALSGEKITPKENILQYGIRHIGPAFKTYWYIFAYVALIPALIFITGGLLFIFGEIYFHQEILRYISYGIMGISVLLFIIFSIYRGIRSSFSLMNAVDKESYTKENFEESIVLTEGKWWQIFWNMVVVGIIAALAISLIENLAGSIGFLGTDFSHIFDTPTNSSQDFIQALGQFTHFNIFSFISSLIRNILGTITGVYISVFLYVMMYMLQSSKTISSAPLVSKDTSRGEL